MSRKRRGKTTSQEPATRTASSKAASARAAATEAEPGGRLAFGPFVRNLLLLVIPAALVWMAITPFYNNFLRVAGENLVHLAESPDVTELLPAATDRHYTMIHRLDFPPARRAVSSFRTTDLHFPLVLLTALFLAVPGVPWKQRLINLGQALLLSVVFHLFLVLFWVKFVYTTQLGAWSLETYGVFARNFWGMGKHLLNLPVKLALPFVLWVGFYLDRLLPGRPTP